MPNEDNDGMFAVDTRGLETVTTVPALSTFPPTGLEAGRLPTDPGRRRRVRTTWQRSQCNTPGRATRRCGSA